MEYDRALYRVYERTIEDLTATSPIRQSRQQLRNRHRTRHENTNNNSNNRSTNDNHDTHDDTEAQQPQQIQEQDQNDNNDIMSLGVHNDQLISSTSHMNNNRSDNSIPFFLPLFLLPYADALIGTFISTNWRLFLNTLRYNLFSSRSLSNSNGHSSSSNNNDDDDGRNDVNHNNNSSDSGGGGRSIRNFLTFRNENRGGGRFSRLSQSVHGLNNLDDNREDITMSASSSNNAGIISSPSIEVEMTDMTHLSTSPSGLRRRTPSQSPNNSPRRLAILSGSGEEASIMIDISNSTDSSIYSTDSYSDIATDTILAFDNNITPTTRSAQEIASTQNERSQQHENNNNNQTNNNNTNNNNSNNNNNTNDDEREMIGCTQKGLFVVMKILMTLAIFHLIILNSLHVTYVQPKSATCIEYALATRPIYQRSKYFQRFGDSNDDIGDDYVNDDHETLEYDDDDITLKYYDDDNNNDTVIVVPDSNEINKKNDTKRESILFGQNEILQIKIIYDKACTGNCSRVHTLMHQNTTNNEINNNGNSSNSKETNADSQEKQKELEEQKMMTKIWNSISNIFGKSSSSSSSSSTTFYNSTNDADNAMNLYSSPEYWETPHYRFATEEALLYLKEDTLLWYNVSFVNVTMTLECLSHGNDEANNPSIITKFAEFMVQIYGFDTVIINQVMYGIRSSEGKFRNGFIQNMYTRERWTYTKQLLDYHLSSQEHFFSRILNKVLILSFSFIAFFFITSVTAIIVRVLTSSGVMILFPLMSLFQSWGFRMDLRLMDYAHPWLGYARRRIQTSGLYPLKHFIYAHLSKLLILYTMYEACQATWGSVFYFKSVPENLPIWIFASLLVYEYFSLIYVRSALSAYFFPRYTMLLFVGYHIYFYSVPYGFFDVAMIPFDLLMCHNMIFTILALEVPASARGSMSLECPREVYNLVSWSEWTASLPGEWTIFLPLNSRYIPLHDRHQEDEDIENDNDEDVNDDNERDDDSNDSTEEQNLV